ncbi:MAG: response regulator [Deltaproteobacteria bacterium]|nr:response regulator [Deltaproteobacteria bacterium]
MDEARILIVDDESDHRFLLTAALQECLTVGVIETACGVEEALAALKDQDFDAVLCDYCLGEGNGLDVLRALRRQNRDVPVLFVTNHGSEEVARQAFIEGVADYVTKDAAFQNPPDLQRKLRRALERQRLKGEKQKAEAIFESFLENNPYAILIFSPDGRILRWNRALTRLERHTEDLAQLRDSYNPLTDPQLLEAGVTPLIHQALSGQWVEIPPFPWDPGRALLQGAPKILRGVAFPIAVEGEKAPHLCAMIQDVTDEERARRERDEYAAILARLLDATEAAIFFVTPDHRVRFANRRVNKFFGVDPGSVIGGPMATLAEAVARCTPSPQEFQERLERLYANPEEETEEPIDVWTPHRRHLRRHSGPVRDANGRLLGRIEVYLDETEAVEKRRLLELQNRELDAFASRLAHDLKTPLVSLKGFVDLLYRQYAAALDPRAALFLEKVRSSASILGEMVDGLRELAHASDDAPCTTLDPLPTLRLVVDALSAEAAERGVEVHLPAFLPPVECDRAKLYQIAQNLISNALRHSDPSKPRRWAKIEAREVGGEVAIVVSDNGVGIEPEEITDLFQPFRRGKQAAGRPGMGLGLAIVQRISQVCRGRVEAVSSPGEGSTFTVFLPRGR